MSRRSAMPAARPALYLALMTLMTCAPGPALAQGPIESFLNNAENFLERQGRAIEREMGRRSRPRSSRARKAAAAPPLPLPNPRRAAHAAEAEPKERTENDDGAPKPSSPERRPDIASREPPVPAPLRAERKAEAPPEPATQTAPSAGHDREAVPLPKRNPATGEAGKPRKPPHPSEIPAENWTKEEIASGRAACKKMLARIDASYEMADPVREGICGAPAPIRLSAINTAQKVEIHPPALVTCALAAALARWMEKTVQPAAGKHLGEQIVALRNVSSYSCRNRYNAPGKHISEHALANALDIAAFETASGKTVTLLQHWYARKPKPAGEPQAGKPKDRPEGKAVQGATGEDEKPEITPVSAKQQIGAEAATAKNPPLPDPKPEKPEAPEMVPAPEANFLHAAFDGACKTFGTALGPEANAAHRDHFHLDMKERTYAGYCE